MTLIDYELLHYSTRYYDELGYKRIEAPWLISEEISNITRPNDVAQYVVHKEGGNVLGDGKRKAFVASGEQSFLYLMAKGFLPSGKYQTVTPCIRNEMFDKTHVKYFTKNELIIIGVDPSESKSCVDEVCTHACDFFMDCVTDFENFRVVETESGFDIKYHDVEIGSYGYRQSMIGNWVYGTGLAEPRFSRLINHHGKRDLLWATT